MQKEIDFSEEEIDVLLYALSHLLGISLLKHMREESSVEAKKLEQMIQKMARIMQILAEHEDVLDESDLSLCMGSLLKIMEYLEVSIPLLHSVRRNDAIDLRHRVNRLVNKLRPICEPIYLKMYSDNI